MARNQKAPPLQGQGPAASPPKFCSVSISAPVTPRHASPLTLFPMSLSQPETQNPSVPAPADRVKEAVLSLVDAKDRTIGAVLLLFGLAFTFFGLLFLLDPAFLALGSVQFMAGLVCFLSPRVYYRLFLKGARAAALTAYAGGLLLILSRHVYSGVVLQLIGFLCLFRPIAAALRPLLSLVPYAGPWLAKIAS